MICPVCKIEFEPVGKQKYCSAGCMVEANNDPRMSRDRKIATNRRNMTKFRAFLSNQ